MERIKENLRKLENLDNLRLIPEISAKFEDKIIKQSIL